MKEIDLRQVYQEAAVAMSECLRAAEDVLAEHKTLDMSPDELGDMVADLVATLVIAQAHIDAMASMKRMMDKGYQTVSIMRINIDEIDEDDYRDGTAMYGNHQPI